MLCGCEKQEIIEATQPIISTTVNDDYIEETTVSIESEQTSTIETTITTTPSQPVETKPIDNDEDTVNTEPTNATTEIKPVETTPFIVETEPTNPPEKTVAELVEDGTYMLSKSYDFYKGSMDMSAIQTITFSNIHPSSYDECWNANVADNDGIVGYRVGADVIIVGEHIYANTNSKYMFAAQTSSGRQLWSSLVKIDGLELLRTSYVIDMSGMFLEGKFSSLSGIGSWSVGSVRNMSMIFSGCTNLTTLDVGSWNVSNVTDFSGIFQGNANAGNMKLQYLDVGNWNTSSAINFSHMFYGCGALTHIPIENWNVSRVATFSHMFADCFSLQSIDISNWSTVSAHSFNAMFNDCRSLTVIDVSGLETSSCTQFSQMFEACTSLQKIIGLDRWNVTSASNYAFSETFHCCYSLLDIDIGNWHTSPDNTARMFKNCYSLSSVDLSGFNMDNNHTVLEMFMNCTSLTEIKGMGNWSLENAEGYDTMYVGTSFENKGETNG